MKYYVCTFGCRCNQADSAAMRESLARRALEETASPRGADLILVNSCTVTERADRDVRRTVRRLHRENPSARVVVTGCYAERAPGEVAALEGVGLVVGNADRERLVDLVLDADADPPSTGGTGPPLGALARGAAGTGPPLSALARGAAGRIVRSPLDAGRDYLLPPTARTGGKTRPFLKIQDGCDARCSYCIIPAVRGPARSALPHDVVAEAERLVGLGYREIVVTGVHLGTYGRKLQGRIPLVELLRRLLAIPGLGRLRLSSIEPMRFSRGIVDLASRHPAFARHFHLPLQSGSDRILRRMRRPYTAARFGALVGAIAARIPAAALGTDVIVGFPGETDSDFEATCEAVRLAPLAYVHVFPFSVREGTDAAALADRVPPGVVEERSRVLRGLSRRKSLEFRRRFAGGVLPGVTLSAEEGAGESAVLTDNYIQVRVRGLRVPPNRLVQVRVDAVEEDGTWGTLVEEPGAAMTREPLR